MVKDKVSSHLRDINKLYNEFVDYDMNEVSDFEPEDDVPIDLPPPFEEDENLIVRFLMKSGFLLLILTFSLSTYAQSLDTKRFEILSGRKLNLDSKNHGTKKFNKSGYIFGKEPADSLRVNNQFFKKIQKFLILEWEKGEMLFTLRV